MTKRMPPPLLLPFAVAVLASVGVLLFRAAAHDGPATRPAAAATEPTRPAGKRVLVFSGTGWYRHPDIAKTNGWLVRTLADRGYAADVTETPKDLTPARLGEYGVLVMNNSNALDVLLDDAQRAAIADWYGRGNGIVALHAALVRQTKWKWFNELAGCDFNSDSEFVRARVVVDPANKDHPAVAGAPAEFWYTADWTNHDRSVTGLPGVRVLLRVDESTYDPVRAYFKTRGGKPMGADHPIAWVREFGGGRFFYTELGHDLRSLETAFARAHVLAAVGWAVGPEPDRGGGAGTGTGGATKD
jgi:type 1 glutamine amidotransferase